MPDKLGDAVRIRHILDAIEEIRGYTKDADFETFDQNAMMHDACIRQLAIIGEACNRISPDVRETHTDIAWRQIIGLRNIVIHQYFGVDNHVIWDVIAHDLPDLEEKMSRIWHRIKQ